MLFAKTDTHNPSHGFQLIEILIVLALVSILTAISVPLYSDFILHARRFEAENILSKLAVAMEEFHFEHFTYANVSLAELGFKENIADNHYQLKIANATQNEYIIAAIPFSHLAQKDTLCATLMMDSQGEKSISGTGNIQECW